MDMRKISFKGHIKKEYRMSLTVKREYQESNQNNLTYCLIDKDNEAEFKRQDFIHPSLFEKGRYIGAFVGEVPVAFLAIVLKGEQAAFFRVRQSDMCLHNAFVFPEWRGREIMGDAISHCICQYFPECQDTAKVSIFVRKDNASAIRCYTKLGFLQEGEMRVIRFIRDYYLFCKTVI